MLLSLRTGWTKSTDCSSCHRRKDVPANLEQARGDESSMTDQPRKSANDSEAELWNAIAAFEKILEVLPNDRASLETLVSAYEKVGDRTRAVEYAIRLTNVLIDASEEDAAQEMLAKLSVSAADDPRVKKLAERFKSLVPDKVMADVIEDEEDIASRSLNMAAEISFAWNLLQAQKLSQDEYSRVVHDLSENSARNSATPISTLHVLQDMNFANMNSVIAFVSSACKIPVISLARFDIKSSVASLLPLSFSVRRGALLFEEMGNDALVAILNPYDDQLPMDLEAATGKTCHLFLAAPDDFDKALARIREMPTP